MSGSGMSGGGGSSWSAAAIFKIMGIVSITVGGLTIWAFSGPKYFAEQTTPTSFPPSGYVGLYPKTDGFFYSIDVNGIERRAGAGGTSTSAIVLLDSAADHTITISASSNEAANRTLQTPTLGGNRYFADVADSGGLVNVASEVTGTLPVANGGTNASSASITAFNNITGYTASGATGTTSTNLVFSTSPTLVTPLLGTPTSGTLTNCTALPLTTGVTGVLPVANGGTNASSASITAFNNITGYTASGATGTTSTNLVFSTSPTLVTPILGTPTSGTLTNCTGGFFTGVQVLTSGTTYTPTTGTTRVVLVMLGGGGGGGGCSGAGASSAAASGGSGGSTLIKTFGSVSGTYTYAIGAGGAGATAGNNNGSAGGNTTFINGGTTYTAGGGGGGAKMAAAVTPNITGNTVGTFSTNGDINGSGEWGMSGIAITATIARGGRGGGSFAGEPGAGASNSGTGSASVNGYGAGGGGGASADGADYGGGAGSAGLILVYEYR